MRYNRSYHHKADEFAKAHGFEFAVYMGHYHTKRNNWLVFVPHYNDNLARKTGLLPYILINEKRRICQVSLNFVLPFTKYDYLKRGRQLFAELEKTWSLDLESEEGQYRKELYAAVKLNIYEKLIPEEDMCLFLQESKRLGRKIEIISIEETTDRCDGWEYYLRLADK